MNIQFSSALNPNPDDDAGRSSRYRSVGTADPTCAGRPGNTERDGLRPGKPSAIQGFAQENRARFRASPDKTDAISGFAQ